MNEEEFRAEYKKVFDEIHAGSDLKNRVLSQKKRRSQVKPILTAGISAVAAIAIFAAVRGYDFDRKDDGVISRTTVSETASPQPEQSAKEQRSEERLPGEARADKAEFSEKKAEDPAAHKPRAEKKKTTEDYKNEAIKGLSTYAPRASERQSAAWEPVPTPHAEAVPEIKPPGTAEAQSAAEAQSTIAPQNTSKDSGIEAVQEESAEDTVQEESAEDTAAEKRSVPRAAKQIVLRMNAPSVLNEILMTAAQETEADYGENMEYSTEEWENSRYFDYIGADILNGTALGDDMVYTGGTHSYVVVDSSGKPQNDTRIFPFNGDGNRYVSIVTSRNADYVDTVLGAEGIQLSEIRDSAAAVFGDEARCEVYVKSGDTSYIINAVGQSERELEDLLLSIVR